MRRRLGLILGSGFTLPRGARALDVGTPYGEPAPVFEVDFAGIPALVLHRHGPGHTVPPHRINHRANLQALVSLGATHVLSFASAGSLHRSAPRGSMVLPDDFVDCTRGVTTVFDEAVRHTPMADPFDLDLALLAREVFGGAGACRLGGTYVGISGPRYPTRAEVRFFQQLGTLIGMTVVQEAILARELGLAYANCSLITDDSLEVRHEAVLTASPELRARLGERLPELVRRFAHDRPPGPVAKLLARRRWRR